MRDIFTELFGKVIGFFRQSEDANSAKDVACNRLKLVLMQDRTNLTPQILERMRGELIDLLSKYVEMDKELLELDFVQEGDQMALALSIPVVRARDEEEIEEAIRKEEEEKAELEKFKLAGSEDESEEVDESEDSETDEDEVTSEDVDVDVEEEIEE